MPDLVDSRLGDFQILGEIGRGGMGIVYEAMQISLGRRVALKVLPFAAAMDSKQLQRFKNEAQAAAHLQHTNIVPVYYVSCERGIHFYAMQFIEGQTLAAVIRELRQLAGLETRKPPDPREPATALASELALGHWAPVKRGGREVTGSCGRDEATGPYLATPAPVDATPPPAVMSSERSSRNPEFFRSVAHLGVQAAEALEHAHQMGVIHRDIKPANLLVDAGGRLWVTDFGLARLGSDAGLTLSGDLVGTLRYMSPEQALAKRVTVDARTDVYSLGVTLYELVALEPAYNGRSREEVLRQITFEEPRPLSRLNKAVPRELETIVLKAMAKNPAERYATAQELTDDLRRFLDDMPIRAKRPTLVDWTRKWVRRHRGVVAVGIAGLVIAVAILAVSTLMLRSAYQTEAKERQNAVKERQDAVTALYRSSVREAEAMRRARGAGYRVKAWQRLQEALRLDTPEKDVNQLRQEAVACMGDFVGLEPITWTDFSGDVNAIAPHRHGGQLALGMSDGTVWLRALGSGESLARLQHGSPITALAFAPDGVRLVVADGAGTVHVWKINGSGEWVRERSIIAEPRLLALLPSGAFPFFVPHVDFPKIRSIAISPDGKLLATSLVSAGLPTTIALWNLARGTLTARDLDSERGLEWHDHPAFSPDGKLLATSFGRIAGEGASVRFQWGVLLWNLRLHRFCQRISGMWMKWTGAQTVS
jgi:serine/threonine protein kinase